MVRVEVQWESREASLTSNEGAQIYPRACESPSRQRHLQPCNDVAGPMIGAYIRIPPYARPFSSSKSVHLISLRHTTANGRVFPPVVRDGAESRASNELGSN